MKLLDVLDSDPIQVSMTQPTMENFEIDEKTKTPDRSGHYWSSSGALRHYIERNYGGDVTCQKAQKVKGDAHARKKVRNAASFYQNLHCVGTKQVKEEDNNQGAALTIFDIDDTLFKTDAKVHVTNKAGERKALSNKEFNNYKLADDEEFDFGEFKDAEKFNKTSTPIQNIWRTAQNTLENIGKRPGSRVVIVTARGDLDNKDLFLDTFRQHGLDMNKVHVYRAGNIKNGNSADKKKIVIRNLLENGNFTEVRLFDDHEENLAEFLKLSQEFPGVIFKAFPVSHAGKIAQPIVTVGNIES
jgi:hypothetical protein